MLCAEYVVTNTPLKCLGGLEAFLMHLKRHSRRKIGRRFSPMKFYHKTNQAFISLAMYGNIGVSLYYQRFL